MSSRVFWKRTAGWFFLLTGVAIVACGLLAFSLAGPPAKPEKVWGGRGIQDGGLVRPRAIALDTEHDRLYLVDFTSRVQVFTLDGDYLPGHTWTTPDYRNGRPSGLSIANDGNLIVSDSHYNCWRIYSPDGQLLRTFGGEYGTAPGQLSYVSDVVQDTDGSYFVAEFGENQRISHFDADGKFLHCWGSHGTEPGQFNRVRALAFGPDGLLYAADACNHRIQVFTRSGDLVRVLGEPGSEPGQFLYPYDVAFGPRGDLYVVEYGNNRVQKLTAEGKPLAAWGTPGGEPGQLHAPWAVAVDGRGRVHVVDTDNHRVQRLSF